jgi:hypothetical protein
MAFTAVNCPVALMNAGWIFMLADSNHPPAKPGAFNL